MWMVDEIAFRNMDTHIMKGVIILRTVIHLLTGSVAIVNFLIFCRPSWNGREKAVINLKNCADL